MTTVLPVPSITAAILDRLETGLVVGDAETPPYPKTSQGLPRDGYAVLWPLGGDDAEGSLNDATQRVRRTYQVTCVGGTRAQAEARQLQVRQLLCGWRPTVPGASVSPVELDDESGVEPDNEPTPTLFYTTDRFRLYVTSG